MEEVDRPFSWAFEQTCGLREVDELVVDGLTHELTAAEVTAVLEKQERLSKAVLSDHGGQFRTRARLSGAFRT